MAKQWINISECARLYGRSRKWVHARLDKYPITTEKSPGDTSERRFQLVDFIAHCGEPESNGTPPNMGKEQDRTSEAALLNQKIEFLEKRIAELEQDRAERQSREARWDDERSRLEGIIERQTYTLPSPERRGLVARFFNWDRN